MQSYKCMQQKKDFFICNKITWFLIDCFLVNLQNMIF